MNKVQYTGRLTKDVIVTTLNNEKKTPVVYFTIAVQDDFNYKNADFINCQAFGPSIKYLTSKRKGDNKIYGCKGAYIEFSGRTKTYQKDDKFGQIASADKVVIIFANSKKEEKKEEESTEDEKLF